MENYTINNTKITVNAPIKSLTKAQVKAAALAVTEKYKLTGKQVTERDFCRVCESESVTVINNDKDYLEIRGGKKNKLGCYFTSTELKDEAFIMLNDFLTGRERLESMFTLLGFHFLYPNGGIKTSEHSYQELLILTARQSREAQEFAAFILNQPKPQKSTRTTKIKPLACAA